MKCIRAKCRRQANAPGQMCVPHYRNSPHGLVDPAPARHRIEELRAVGLSWPRIEQLTGLSINGMKNMGRWTAHARICLDTHERVMAVPVPSGFVESMVRVPGVGTRRRIQALMAIGWRQGDIARECGFTHQQTVSDALYNDFLSAATAARIKDGFDRLHMTRGPSRQIEKKAQNWGYLVPFAWDDDTIDDPNAVPNVGDRIHVTAKERIAELQELGVTDHRAIAERLGIKAHSVERQIARDAA